MSSFVMGRFINSQVRTATLSAGELAWAAPPGRALRLDER